MNAIAADPPTEADDAVADLRLGRVRAVREDAEGTAIDQRVADIAGVVEHRAVDGGQPELVSVVTDAGDDAIADAAGMQHSGGQLVVRQIGRAEAQNIGAGDRTGRHADDVADHTTDAGVGAAERFKRRRVVVGLDLERNIVVVVEGDDPGVVDERRTQPRWIEFLRDFTQRRKQAVVKADGDLAVGRGVRERDAGPERLVHTVLGPGLGEGLEFGVGGRTSLGGEVRLDRLHFGQIEGEDPILGQAEEVVVAQLGERHVVDPHIGCCRPGELGRQFTLGRDLDGVVREQPPGEGGHVGVGEVTDEVVATSRDHPDLRQAEIGRRSFEFSSVGVGRTRHQRHLDHTPLCRCDAVDHGLVDNGVDQHFPTEPIELIGAQRSVDVMHPCDPARGQPIHADQPGVRDDRAASWVVGGGDVDAHGHRPGT